jgi:hypothetical protein
MHICNYRFLGVGETKKKNMNFKEHGLWPKVEAEMSL